jgi:anti-anti-sigma factor
MSAATARYAREGGTWFVKLGGDLRHPLGPALNALLDRAFADAGFRQIVIDLCEAQNIDSTCLGIVARAGVQAQRNGAEKPVIISDNDDINKVLLAMCFDRLFNLVDESGLIGEDLQPVPAAQADAGGMLQLVLEAHRRLCAIDERTNAVFRDLVSALEQEAKQSDSG